MALVAFGLVAALWTRGTGEIRHRGEVLRMPLPYASIKISSEEDRATYFMVGYPDFRRICASRGGRSSGWAFADQMGSVHVIASTADEKLRFAVFTELRTVYFTQIDVHVEDRRTGGP